MSQMQEIKIHLDGVSNVLKTKRFRVPAYQRSYSWEHEHIQSLLNDVSDAIKNKEKEYFLGSIVVTGPADQRYEVVDGQQRLTTVSLLIAAIKDIFEASGDSEVVSSVKTEFLASTDRKTKEKEPKLVLNEVDNELYQELIEGIQKTDGLKYPRQSHKRLLEAAKSIYKYMEDLCSSSKDAEADLHAWLDYLEVNLKVIVVTAPDDSNAFIIFETLNDRGLELAISDLLKNYLFHRSSEKIEETKNRWLSMVAVLESASDDPLVVTYLRQFAMSKYGLVREKELFGLIKRKITSKKTALQFSTELAATARVYSALINTDHDHWNKFDPSVKENVSVINLLGMTQIRPLLLAILEKFDPANVSKSFQKLVSAAVRFQIVGGVGGGSLERMYAETAKSVTDGAISTAQELLKAFVSLPTDSAFEQAFEIASISKQSLARYYLRSLEEGVMSKADEKVPSKDTGRVNLEHVLPITPNQDWGREWSPEDARAFQKRIGNLALVSAKGNSTVGNEKFEEKKKLFIASSFHFTAMIGQQGKWGKSEIDARQKLMAKTAVKVWSVK
jgi:uncharacterized protein with ParB-like and HNH nuclease domain